MLKTVLQISILILAIVEFAELRRRIAKRPPLHDTESGELVLQCSVGLLSAIAAGTVFGPIAVELLALILPNRGPGDAYMAFGMGLFPCVLGGGLCVYCLRRRTRVSERGITSEYVFARPWHMTWEEVVRVKFSGPDQLFLYDQYGKRAWLYLLFVGIDEVIPLLHERLSATVQEKDRKALERFASELKAFRSGPPSQWPWFRRKPW